MDGGISGQLIHASACDGASSMPELAGITPWVLMDFRSPSRMLPGVQDYHNRKGLISNRGERKLAFYMLQNFTGRWQVCSGAAAEH